MKTIGKLSVLALVMSTAVLFSGCSKEKKLEKRLTGTWNVSSYEGDGTADEDGTHKTTSGSHVEISISKEGTYTFNDDGTGSYDLTYDMQMDQKIAGFELHNEVSTSGTFTWNNDGNSVTIKYENGNQDEFSVEVNEKNKQVWTGNSDQTVYSGTGVNVNTGALHLDLNVTMTLEKE